MQALSRNILLIVAILTLAQGSFSQDNRKADSLLYLINNTKEDTVKLRHFIVLIKEYKRTDLGRALEYGDEGLLLAEKIGSNYYIGEFLAWKGSLFTAQGEYAKALDMTLRALELAEQLKDSLNVSVGLNSIGQIYYYQKQFEEAIAYFKQALTLNRKLGNKDGMASAYSNIGACFIRGKQLDSALVYHRKALAITETFDDKGALAECWINIGNVYYYKEDFDKAVEYYFRAQETYNEIDDKYIASLLLINIGTIYSKTNRFSEAIKNFHKSIVLAEEIGSKDLISQVYLKIAIAYSKQNDWKKAYQYYEQFAGVKDSIYSEESSKQMAEMQTKYETEKKEKKIALQKLNLEQKELELNKRKIMGYALGGGVLMLVLLVFVIYNRYRLKRKANAALENAYQIIEEKNNDINDSIAYARNIQQAILPDEKEIGTSLPNHFVFFQPKDVVSGDFYWFHDNGKKVIIIAADCTGHGVPGAFVSMVGNNLLNQVVIEKKISDPGRILTRLNIGVNIAFKREGSVSQANDGMDIAVCVVDKAKKQVEFAGAQNPLIHVRKGEVMVFKADSTPIGGRTPINHSFTTHRIELEGKDAFYIFSDGYPDQFGGPKGKKFMIKRFKEMLAGIYDQPFDQQKQHVHRTFTDWIEKEEQIDDVLVIGFSPV